MDTTTVRLMQIAANASRAHQDSLAAATRDHTQALAEWILLRQDLVHVSWALFPSLALVLFAWIWKKC